MLKSETAAAAAGADNLTVSLPNETIRCKMTKPSGNLPPGLPAVRRDNFTKGGHTNSFLKPISLKPCAWAKIVVGSR